MPHCTPGALITSITFDVVFDSFAGGWVSDYIQINDHDWEFGCSAAGTSIPIGDWVRVAIYCVPGSGFRLYYLANSAHPISCYPGNSLFPCSIAGQFTTGVGIDSCSPFHASGFHFQGATYNEDPDTYFERWDFTS